MNLSSIGSASSATSGFLSEPPLSPGPAPTPAAAPLPQLRTVDAPPASEASSTGPEPQAPLAPVAPVPPLAPAPSVVDASEAKVPAVAPVEAPAAPSESPTLESTLLRMRLVTPDQIASAMREEAETGRPIAEIVVANGWVSADDLARLRGGAPTPTPAPVAVVEPSPSPPEPVTAAPAPTPAPAPAPAPTPVTIAAPEAPVAEPPPAPAQAPPAPAPSRVGVGACVLARLANGERIDVGRFDDFDAAKTRAHELMAELRHADEWPFLGGRYVRPDAIVSVDIDLTSF
jgi:hypothetical protein